MKSMKANKDAMIVMRKGGNIVNAKDVAEAKKLAGNGYEPFINKSGIKIIAEKKTKSKTKK